MSINYICDTTVCCELVVKSRTLCCHLVPRDAMHVSAAYMPPCGVRVRELCQN